jgi:archaellum biogenesis protein FlaJ (TadC family)
MLWWAVPISIFMFLSTLLFIPMIVIRLPEDYFVQKKHSIWDGNGPLRFWHVIWVLARNLLGLMLIILGVMMLVLPGQGVLTILLGIIVMDFPGKFTLERRLVRRPGLFKALNWLRERAHHPPLRMPLDD